MRIIENLIEKYDWAINWYIIGSIVAKAAGIIVVVISAYGLIKTMRRDKITAAKRHKEFERRAAESRKRMEERRDDFFKK